MKKLFGILCLLSVVCLSAISCSSSTDHGIDNRYLSLGSFSYNPVGDSSILLDDGTALSIRMWDAPCDPDLNGQRIVVVYNILDERTDSVGERYIVRVLEYESVLTKDPVPASEIDVEEAGSDPIHVRKSWFTSRYLNVNIELLISSLQDGHRINLVVDEGNPEADGDNVFVELKHKVIYGSGGEESGIDISKALIASGNMYNARYTGYLSFDMTRLVPAGKTSVTVHLSYMNYQGERVTDSGKFKLHGD